MHSDSLNSFTEAQDVLDQAIFDHTFPVSHEVEKQLKSAIEALQSLQNNQQSFYQSSTQPQSRPLWRELRKLAMNACLFPLESQALGRVFSRTGPISSEHEVEILAKLRHLMYEPKRGLSFRARVRSRAQSSDTRTKDLKYALPAALSDVAVVFLRAVLQDEVEALDANLEASFDDLSLHSISEFKRVSAAYSKSSSSEVTRTAAAHDAVLLGSPEGDFSSVSSSAAPNNAAADLLAILKDLPQSISQAIERGIAQQARSQPMNVASAAGAPTSPSTTEVNPLAAVYLTDMLTIWKTYSSPTEKTVDEARRSIRKFDEFCILRYGKKFELYELTRECAIAWRDYYLEQPAYNNPTNRVSVNTIAKHFGLIGAVISAYRIQFGLPDGHEFAKPFHRKTKRAESVKIEHFELSELSSIVNSQHYLNLKHRVDDAARGALRLAVPFAALTGARLEEIAQLKAGDFYQLNGVWFAKIVSEPKKANTLVAGKVGGELKERRTKTRKTRHICLPHALMQTAAGERIKALVKGQADQFFIPGVDSDMWGNRSASISKAFARFLDEVGIRSRSKVFHSFRHTFEEFAKGFVGAGTPLGVHREIIDAQIGHGDGGNNKNRYGSENFPVQRLALAFANFIYPAIDF
jgi:integrase